MSPRLDCRNVNMTTIYCASTERLVSYNKRQFTTRRAATLQLLYCRLL